MVNKVMKVFYGENCLPYKDKSRTVIYPVIGSSFLGASNTTEIWFYFDKIGEPNNTWVAIAKLPNGKRGAVKLDTFNDTELNEPYAKLQLNTWFTQMRGDVYISLNGYDGGITLSLDQETGLYEVTGTPVIQATGSVKLTIQYATQLIGGDEVDEITLQEIYAMFGEKLDTNKGIVVIANPQVDISEYDVGQYFYSKSDNSVYEKVNNALTLRFTAYSKSESDTLLATKVDKTTDANIVYGTNNNGEQYKVPYSSDYSGKGNNLVQRDSNAQINVPTTPTSNNHSTSKGYVDTQVDTRVAKTNVGDKVYGTDENGNQKTFDVDSDLVSGENGIVVRRLYPNGQVIVGNPIATNHATPKQYVDNNFAHTLDLTIDSNFDLVVKLLNANGVVISQDDVDLPLESIVVSATYYDTYTYQGTTYEKVLVIVLATTNVPTIIPIGDLVSGLVSTDELTTALSGYVEKVAGKGLSTNDFTNDDKSKLDGIEAGAEVNVIDEITINDVPLVPVDKSVNIDLTGYQEKLVSGTNIKSINNTSLLGSGNYTFDATLSESSTNAPQNQAVTKELEKKANVDGNYPTLTAGLADNLTPYSEDSGASQENPFISNGTGTNNNTEIVTVGDYGLLKEKQGNSLVVNQWRNNYVSSVTDENVSITNNNNQSISLSGTSAGAFNYIELTQSITFKRDGRKYLIFASQKFNNLTITGYGGDSSVDSNTGYIIFSKGTSEDPQSDWSGKVAILDRTSTTYNISNLMIYVIDLTQMFNGNIPQDLLDNPEHISWYYNGSLEYNKGSLDNANGVKLVSTGRNLFDKSTAILGKIINTSGVETHVSNYFHSDYIKCIPNTDYNFKGVINWDIGGYVVWFDKNMNFITYNSTSGTMPLNVHIKSPSNAYYMVMNGISSAIDNATVSLWYATGDGYDKYYPYEAPKTYDTGTETLRSAGSVRDIKQPDGTIHRLVGSVDLSTLTWKKYADNKFSVGFNLIKDVPNNIPFNGLCDKLTVVRNRGTMDPSKKQISYYNGTLFVANTDWTNASDVTGTLYFELETPTTEQGTPFAENLPINDYGMLYWLDSNDNLVGIPQGAKIFYPTNYKGFVDDMYSRVDGDSSAYVIQSELQASETKRDTVDTQLKNAIGGALRQLLAVSKSIDFLNTGWVDLGKCTITYEDPANNRIRVNISGLKTGTANILCSAYKSQAANQNGCVYAGTSDANTVSITDSRFTSIDVATQLLKGVLLAYEKA